LADVDRFAGLAKVIVQSPMSWCKSSTPPPPARGTKSLVKALIMVQEVLSDHKALPAQAKDEVLVNRNARNTSSGA